MLRVLCLIFSLGFILNAQASMFPRGCEVSGFGFSDNYLVLNDQNNQNFYLIQNSSDKAIALEAVDTQNFFMTPKLHTKLDATQWAAFASDIANQHFKCFIQEEDKINPLNCKDVLQVCQYPRVKFALSNMGNYWVSTNKNQAQVVKDAAAKGILLRW